VVSSAPQCAFNHGKKQIGGRRQQNPWMMAFEALVLEMAIKSLNLLPVAPGQRSASVFQERRRIAPSTAKIHRRQWMLAAAKWLLVTGAVGCLVSIALWPRITGQRHASAASNETSPNGGGMSVAVYHSVDARGEPYTLTADFARQVSASRVDLASPKADLTQSGGGWLLLRSDKGVYDPGTSMLDLSGDVLLYRDDGMTLRTSSATAAFKSGAATGSEPVHAEGPFGTLDAHGFVASDRGRAVEFTGVAHLSINGAK
jgi:lipopolysaccharide export system protein LptC